MPPGFSLGTKRGGGGERRGWRRGEGEGRGSRKGGKEGRKKLEVGRGREASTVLHWGLMRPPHQAASPSLWRLPMVAGVLLRINQMMPQTFSL